MKKKAIIITGSGRSGTYNTMQFIKKYTNYSVYHELQFDEMLKLGVFIHEGHNDTSYHDATLTKYLDYLDDRSSTSIDVSNAAVWCLEELKSRKNELEFILLVRNGYKVVSSFFYKFEKLMYPENMIAKCREAMLNRDFSHSLDKTFWRPLPTDDDFYKKYENNLRFAIICWYWVQTLKNYEHNSDKFLGMFRFEDVIDGSRTKKFIESLGIQYQPEMQMFFQNPTNIENRHNFRFTAEQQRIFDEICGELMNKYYHDLEYYDVKY